MLVLLTFICAFALLHLAAHYIAVAHTNKHTAATRENKPQLIHPNHLNALIYYCCKPLPILLLAYYLITSDLNNSPKQVYAWWIIAGLLFSVVGDIFLMLPKDRFIPGLASFFVAHLAYCSAFFSQAELRVHWVLFGSLGAIAVVVWNYLKPGIAKGLRAPVVAYLVIILTMSVLAGMAFLQGRGHGSYMAFFGALIFMLSDSVLAIHRFRIAFYSATAIIMVSYYCAQSLIALSVFY